MKGYNLIILGTFFFIFGCAQNYIDEIRPVEQGTDTAAPEININFPLNGTQIRVTEEVTTLNIDFEVVDDIEIGSVIIKLNGNQFASFSEFKDYRRFIEQVTYPTLGNGEHTLTIEATDLSGKTTSKTVEFEKIAPYIPQYDGEIFYLPFDGDFMELVQIQNANVNGNPGFADGLEGRAYSGAVNAYLTFPTEGLLHDEFSAVFWYKVNASPDRAGILVIGPPDPNNPTNMNNRRNGFRLFRENAGGKQRVKLNVGNGNGDNWFDGGAAADIDPAAGNWVHVAFSISQTRSAVYLNGKVVREGAFPGVDWSGCDILSIASGAPRFTQWGHLSDTSLIDELRLFDKALSKEEIQKIMEDEKP